MSVKVRLTKTGGTNDPCYRVVATDTRSPRDGKYIELLGWYDPKRKGANFQIKVDRIDYWKQQGAILSDTVRSLLKKAKIAALAAPAPVAAPVVALPAAN